MEIPDARRMLRVLVHGSDIVIYTCEIQQTHVPFYWVSTYINDYRTCGLHTKLNYLHVTGVIT